MRLSEQKKAEQRAVAVLERDFILLYWTYLPSIEVWFIVKHISQFGGSDAGLM